MRQNKNPGIMKVVRKVKTMNLVRWLHTLYEEHIEINRDWSYLRKIAKAEGWAEGIAEGRVTGIAIGALRRLRQDILDLLEELGEIPKDILERILAEKDTEPLSKWLKVAAKATSFEDFRKKVM